MQKEQRQFHAMRAHVQRMLASGWTIVSRHPLQLRHGSRQCQVAHGMLISESLI